jgi:sugar transferase (PEP-CTERM system associated)
MLRIFRQYYPVRNIFFIIGEGIFIFGSVLASAIILIGPSALRQETWFYGKLLLITVVCQTCLYYNELYDLKVTDCVRELSTRLLQSFGFASVFLGVIYFAFPETIIGSAIFMIGVAIVIVLIACWRFLYFLVLGWGLFNQQIILLGSGDLIQIIREEIKVRKDCGYTVALEIPESIQKASPDCPAEVQLVCQNKFEGLCELGKGFNIKKIVVSFHEKRAVLPTNELLRCRVEGIDVIEGNSFFEMLTGKLLVESINPGWLIFSRGFRKSWMRRFIKRSVDLVLSIVMLAVLSPIFFLAAIAIKLDSPGPVFFVQQRIGERHRNYRMYKFRSMVKDAEKLSGAVWAQENDPRVTRMGRLLRRLRIDELPQLWNVLKGEMSFVGPRPEREPFVEELEKVVPYYRERFAVKPGISGWAQVNYGYGASVRDAVEKLNYDLFYIKNMSIFMDVLVILRTIKILMFGYGVR